ncbi:MAG: hypothetical protein QXV17_04910 [Candidatus Micrarchaeaceae archaeon]
MVAVQQKFNIANKVIDNIIIRLYNTYETNPFYDNIIKQYVERFQKDDPNYNNMIEIIKKRWPEFVKNKEG